MEKAQIKQVMEAALLSAHEPLAMPDLKRLFSDEYGAELLGNLLDELVTDFAERAVELVRVASGWRFQTRAELAVYLERLTPEKAPRYSRAVMETLAIIAYRAPVTRGDIEEIRGVSVSSQIIKTLEERGWIDVIGHKEVIGRPALFGTTDQFLDDLGIRTLKELPPIDDLAQNDETLEMFGKNLVGLSPPQNVAPASDELPSAVDSQAAPESESGDQLATSDLTDTLLDDDVGGGDAPMPIEETVSGGDEPMLAGEVGDSGDAAADDEAASMENR